MMSEAQLVTFVRAHAQAQMVCNAAGECVNGWDKITEFLTDEDILAEVRDEEMRTGRVVTEAQLPAIFKRLADEWVEYWDYYNGSSNEGS